MGVALLEPVAQKGEPSLAYKHVLISVRVSNGFPKSHRLIKTDEFSSVFSFKCSVKGRWFLILARPNALLHARLGVVVAKKTVRKAVARNYIKRVVRDSFRQEHHALAGLDVVVRVHHPYHQPDYPEVRRELAQLFSRSKKCLIGSSSSSSHINI